MSQDKPLLIFLLSILKEFQKLNKEYDLKY